MSLDEKMMTPVERKAANAIKAYVDKEAASEKRVFKSEAAFQTFCLKRLKAIKKHIKVFKTMRSNEVGVADLILCVDGKYVAIELKHQRNVPTVHQSKFINEVRDAGGIARVAWSWKDVKTTLKEAGFDIVEYEIDIIRKTYQSI